LESADFLENFVIDIFAKWPIANFDAYQRRAGARGEFRYPEVELAPDRG
jgi:hypothetical protein